MEIPRVRSRTLGYLAAGLVVWSVMLWFAWISQPLSDEISIVATDEAIAGLDLDAQAVETRTAEATCSEPWQSSSGPRPALPALDDSEQYGHVPCQRVVRDNRIVLGMNAAVVLFGLFAVFVLFPRRIRSSADDSPVVTPDLTAIS